jgi:hypothetical protein
MPTAVVSLPWLVRPFKTMDSGMAVKLCRLTTREQGVDSSCLCEGLNRQCVASALQGETAVDLGLCMYLYGEKQRSGMKGKILKGAQSDISRQTGCFLPGFSTE